VSAEPPVDGPAAAEAARPWLTRNLRVLSLVSFLQDAASELLYPVLPIFLTVTLGAPVAVVGLVEGIAEGSAAATKLAAGRLSDRYRRRPLIAVGYGLAALGKVLVALAGAWPVVLAGRGVDRLGKGIRGVPRDALIVVGMPVGDRGKAFGFHRAMDTAGAVVGPLLGLAGYELLHHHIRPLLVIAIVPATLSVLAVFAVRDPSPTHRPTSAPVRAVHPVRWRALPAPYWRVLVPLITFSLVNFPDALLLLRVKELGYALPGIISAYVLYNISYALLSYPAGALSDRLPRQRVFAAGLVCFATAYLGLGLAAERRWVWPLLVVYGAFTACTDGVGKAWVSSLVGPDVQGSAQGLFQGATGAAVLVAGVWAGLLWGGGGRLPLLLSGTVAAVLAVVILTRAPRSSAVTGGGHDM